MLQGRFSLKFNHINLFLLFTKTLLSKRSKLMWMLFYQRFHFNFFFLCFFFGNNHFNLYLSRLKFNNSNRMDKRVLVYMLLGSSQASAIAETPLMDVYDPDKYALDVNNWAPRNPTIPPHYHWLSSTLAPLYYYPSLFIISFSLYFKNLF